MDKSQALDAFFNSFGWDAYDENTVDDDEPFPYVTYENMTSNIGNAVFLSASLWDRSNSWATVEQKARQIAEYLGTGGVGIAFDGGMMMVKQGTSFSQRQPDKIDTIRRIILNFAVEFISDY